MSSINEGDSITSGKDSLPCEEKFAGQGITFKAKLIGVDPVTGPRGDKMCQSALQRLKTLIKETGSHKQRIVIKISLEGVTIKDEKTGENISSYSIPLISYIARDATDKRAFGFVYGSPDTGHQFIGIKTVKSAIPVMKTIGELFTFVYEQKKRNQSIDSGASGEAVHSDGDLGMSNMESKTKSKRNKKSLFSSLSSSSASTNQETNPPPLPPTRNESTASESNGNTFPANFDDAFVNMSNLKDVIASAKQASDPYANWESFDDELNSSQETPSFSKSSQRSIHNLPVIPSPTRSPGRTRESSSTILKIKPPVNTSSRKNKSGPSSFTDGPNFANFGSIGDPSGSFDGSAKSISSGRATSQSSLDQAFHNSSRHSELSESEQQHQLKLKFQQLHLQTAMNNQQMNTLFNNSLSSHGAHSYGSPSSGSLANSFSSSGAGLFTSPPTHQQLADSFSSSFNGSKPQLINKINFTNITPSSMAGVVSSPPVSFFGSPANNSTFVDQLGTSMTSSPATSSITNTTTPVTSPYNGAGTSNSNHNSKNASNNSNSSGGDRYAVFSEIHSMTSSIFDKLAEEKKKQEHEAQLQQNHNHHLNLQQQQQQKHELLQQQYQHQQLQAAKLQQQQLLALRQQQLAIQQQQLQQQMLYQQQFNQQMVPNLMNGLNGLNNSPSNAVETGQKANTSSDLVCNAGPQASSTNDLTLISSGSSVISTNPPRPSRPESQKSNDSFETSSIFADLDPLGVGKEKPLRDKSEFFQDIKSQQKKPVDLETKSNSSLESTNLNKEKDPFAIPADLLAQAHLTHLNQHHQAHLLQQHQLLQQAQQQQAQQQQQHALQFQQQAQLQLQQQQLALRQQQLHSINPHLQLQHPSSGLSSVGQPNTHSFHVSASPSPQTTQDLRPSSSASAASRNPFLSDSSDDLFANSPVLSSPTPTSVSNNVPTSSVYPSSSSSTHDSSSVATLNRHNSSFTNVNENSLHSSNNSLSKLYQPPSTTSTPPPPITALQSTTITTQPHNISFPLTTNNKGFTSTRKLSFDSEVFQPNWSSMTNSSGTSADDNPAVAVVLGNATAMITTTSMIIAGNSNGMNNPLGNMSENQSVTGLINNPTACNNVESIVTQNRSLTPLSVESRSSRSPSSLSNPRFFELSSSSNARFSPFTQTAESFINPSLENLSPLPPPRPPPREFHDTSNSSQSTSRDGSPPPVPPRPLKGDSDCDMPPPPLPKRKPSNPNILPSSMSMTSGEIGASKPSAIPFYGSPGSHSFGSRSVQPPETFAPPLPLPQRKHQSRSNSSLKGYNPSSNDVCIIDRQHQLQQHMHQMYQMQQLQQQYQPQQLLNNINNMNNPQSHPITSQLSVVPTSSMVSASSSGMYDPFDCAFVTNTLHLTDANSSPKPSERSSPRPGLTDGSYSIINQTPNNTVGGCLSETQSLSRSVIGLDKAKLSRGSSYSSDSLPIMRMNLSNSFETGKNLDRFSTPLSAFGVGGDLNIEPSNNQIAEMSVHRGFDLNSTSSFSAPLGESNSLTDIKSTPNLSQISNITRITPGFIDSFTGELSFNTSGDANTSIFEPWKPLTSLEKSPSLSGAISRSSPAHQLSATQSGVGANSGIVTHGVFNATGDQHSSNQTGQQKLSTDPNSINDPTGRNPSPFYHFGEEHVSPPERNIFRKESDPFADDFFQPDTSSS